MTGSMRAVAPNANNVDNVPSNPMMMGGKRRRSNGSMKSKKSKKSKKSRRAHSSRKRSVKKGGMGLGFGAVLQEAIVPFGLFAWQKKSQKRRDDKRSFRKFKSQSRR
jgi:hypothetical protein